MRSEEIDFLTPHFFWKGWGGRVTYCENCRITRIKTNHPNTLGDSSNSLQFGQFGSSYPGRWRKNVILSL